jgi:hypothetical protein
MTRREENQPMIKPTPTLVIGLDEMGIDVAADVRKILRSSNPQQFALTTFLSLDLFSKETDNECPNVAKLTEIKDQENLHVFDDKAFSERDQLTRRTIFECITQELPHLQATLRKSFHQLRTHERLIEAGLGSERIVPFDVILAADLTSLIGSGAFLPVVSLLQQMLATEAYGMGHFLISIADFSSSMEKDALANLKILARPYASLLELDALADPRQDELRQRLATVLEMDALDPLSFRMYLFDHKKEGGSEVKDRDELRVIMGNFLLAMLLGGFARSLTDGMPWAEIQDRRAFFNSASATIAMIDPRPLLDVCALRLGTDFLMAEMNVTQPCEHQQVHQLTSEIKARLGETGSWLRKLCKSTPLDLVIREHAWDLKMHFDDIEFKDVPEVQWADTIRSYAENFESEKLPAYQERIGSNCTSLIDEILAVFKTEASKLPQTPCIYPGGLQASKSILIQLAKWLAAEDTATRESDIHIDASLNALSQVAQQVKPVPPWLSTILRIAGIFMDVDDFVRWWRYRDTHIVALREKCLQLLEQKYAAQLENTLRNHLQEVNDELNTRILKCLEQLDLLSDKIEVARRRLSLDIDAYAASNSSFRVTPIDKSIIESVYIDHKPASEIVRQALLEKHAFLSDWSEVGVEALTSRLIQYGHKVFAHVVDLSLEEVLQKSSEHTAVSVFSNLSQGAVPLLKPEFDAIGIGYSHVARYVLIPSAQKTILRDACESLLNRWECVFSGIFNLVVCVQVRHFIPIKSLKNFTNEGYKAYQRLDDGERDQLHLLKIEC